MLHSSSSWIWRMAWRDSRANRQRLLLFVSSITLWVAALMAISSFGVNLRQGLDFQAKTLLGADLVIRARQPFSDAAEQLFRTIGGEQARETSFSSMVLFPKTVATRLAQVRALEGRFPFFGHGDGAGERCCGLPAGAAGSGRRRAHASVQPRRWGRDPYRFLHLSHRRPFEEGAWRKCLGGSAWGAGLHPETISEPNALAATWQRCHL